MNSREDSSWEFEEMKEKAAGSRRLYQNLLSASVDMLPPQVTSLIIVPDGPLHRIPFGALLGDDGQPLVQRYEIAMVPSTSTWLHTLAFMGHTECLDSTGFGGGIYELGVRLVYEPTRRMGFLVAIAPNVGIFSPKRWESSESASLNRGARDPREEV